MELWTWQNTEVVIYDGGVEYDSLKHSEYLNDNCIAASERYRHREAYEKLWSILGTDRPLWCFTEKDKAKGQPSPGKCKLWELNVPEEEVCIVCSVAWNWILGHGCNSKACDVLCNIFLEKLPRCFTRDNVSSTFHSYWKTKDLEQLWEVLFRADAKACWNGCPQAIVSFPVKEEWLVR